MKTEQKNQLKKELFWYINLLIAVFLLAVYWKDYVSVSTFLRDIEPVLPKIASILITLFIFNVFIKSTIPVLKKGISLYFNPDEWNVIRMLYTYFLWFIAFIIILTGVFGNFSSLGISISLIGAGIAFALQQVILSFAGWFLIIIKRPYKIGDRIYIKNRDVLGDVEDITMLITVLKEVAHNDTVTGKNIILPNSTVFLEPIINYSYDVPQIWISLPVDVTYESDLELAEKIIFDVAKDVAGEEMKTASDIIKRKTPESVHAEFATEDPVIRVEFAGSSVTIRARIMCMPKRVPAISSDIYRKVFHEFNKPENKGKVEIAYPHMELVLHDEVMSDRVKKYFDR
ncbi:MAG: mechanosensitive ion channel [Candidatus Methanoperedens sp.]|jgi:small-conductance mechanosensitive channel|nr:mechanosensitive ion channel [Candidatus Methanoperedens sp.]PKL53134.1 MAG: hypothetical protein CVV36_08660 [Candidatus Methanoperedenaceae archaeon HGW-Methanoperedenaceae-1]